MQQKSQNKMLTGSDESLRTKAIREWSKSFTPTEITVLLKRNGFTPVSRQRINVILGTPAK